MELFGSAAVVISIVSAAWYLSRTLTRLEDDLKDIKENHLPHIYRELQKLNDNLPVPVSRE